MADSTTFVYVMHISVGYVIALLNFMPFMRNYGMHFDTIFFSTLPSFCLCLAVALLAHLLFILSVTFSFS